VVDLFEDDEFVGEEAKGPASAPVGRLAGREGDEMGFIFTVIAFVVTVGVAAESPQSLGDRSVCVRGRALIDRS